eukprot:991223-Pyramimonas_sp.AAC.1
MVESRARARGVRLKSKKTEIAPLLVGLNSRTTEERDAKGAATIRGASAEQPVELVNAQTALGTVIAPAGATWPEINQGSNSAVVSRAPSASQSS